MSVRDVADFVMKHSERGTCRCGRCADHPGGDSQPTVHTFDMVFFEVCAANDPSADEFRSLITASTEGDFCRLDPWDGQEHSYMEVGGWIGDQGLAMQFMALGHLLGLWKVFTPRMLPGIPDDLAMQMAGSGLLSIMPLPTHAMASDGISNPHAPAGSGG